MHGIYFFLRKMQNVNNCSIACQDSKVGMLAEYFSAHYIFGIHIFKLQHTWTSSIDGSRIHIKSCLLQTCWHKIAQSGGKFSLRRRIRGTNDIAESAKFVSRTLPGLKATQVPCIENHHWHMFWFCVESSMSSSASPR